VNIIVNGVYYGRNRHGLVILLLVWLKNVGCGPATTDPATGDTAGPFNLDLAALPTTTP